MRQAALRIIDSSSADFQKTLKSSLLGLTTKSRSEPFSSPYIILNQRIIMWTIWQESEAVRNLGYRWPLGSYAVIVQFRSEAVKAQKKLLRL